MKFGDDYKKSFLITSILYLLLGVVLLFFPQFDEMTICYALGGITILMGLFYIIIYFARTDFEEVYRLDFVYGVVLLGAGIYAIAQPFMVAQWLYVIVGLAICLDSLIKLQNSIDLKRLHSSVWWAVLLMALVTAAMGIMVLFAKTYAFMTPTQFIGISLVVDGVINVLSFSVLAFNLSRLRKAKRLAAEQAGVGEPESEPQPEAVPEHAEKPAEGEQETPKEEKKHGFFSMLHGEGADEKAAAAATAANDAADAAQDAAEKAADDAQTAPQLDLPDNGEDADDSSESK